MIDPDRAADQLFPVHARLERKRRRWKQQKNKEKRVIRVSFKRTKESTLVGKATKTSTPFPSGHAMVDRGSTKGPCTNEACTCSLVCTCSQVQSPSPCTEGDLMDFQQDVPYVLNTNPGIVGSAEKVGQASNSSQNLVDRGDLTVNHSNDNLIDFQSSLIWPTGETILHNFKRSPQVKRKLEHPEMKTVTAHLVKTPHGFRIIVKGLDDVTNLSKNQIEFIRGNIKGALIQEQAKAKVFGAIPPTQVTFQLGIGKFVKNLIFCDY